MYKSIILPLAEKDIREAAFCYNEKQIGPGKRFITAVREKVRFIEQNPKICIVRYNSVRTVVLNKFPFMIHYTINQSNKTVIVSAVLHTSRNPDIWKNR